MTFTLICLERNLYKTIKTLNFSFAINKTLYKCGRDRRHGEKTEFLHRSTISTWVHISSCPQNKLQHSSENVDPLPAELLWLIEINLAPTCGNGEKSVDALFLFNLSCLSNGPGPLMPDFDSNFWTSSRMPLARPLEVRIINMSRVFKLKSRTVLFYGKGNVGLESDGITWDSCGPGERLQNAHLFSWRCMSWDHFLLDRTSVMGASKWLTSLLGCRHVSWAITDTIISECMALISLASTWSGCDLRFGFDLSLAIIYFVLYFTVWLWSWHLHDLLEPAI